jgi:hypothetical protein
MGQRSFDTSCAIDRLPRVYHSHIVLFMPNSENPWVDPKTFIAIGGLTIGILGLFFGLLRDQWSRRESRLDALGKVLHSLVRAAQDLVRANNSRRTAEQLRHAYPLPHRSKLEGVDPEKRFPEATPEVIKRINSLVDNFNQHLKTSEQHFRDAESEIATRHFRFPTRVAKQIKDLQDCVSELGRVVDSGLFDKADIQLAQFRDKLKLITDTAKGWRLADPFEGFRKRFLVRNAEDEERPSEFELTKDEMNGVMELVSRRATSQGQNSFAIHPPQKLIENPSLLESDSVIDELKDSVFSVVFQDGTAKMLSLPELMAFTFNLIVLAQESKRIEKMVAAVKSDAPTSFNVSFQFAMQHIMTPETVKVLLSKIAFSETPSDA